MFRVRLVARPDARMVEVPLEIEAELPRDFEGAALLSSSGLPRKVRLKAQRDALKLSTAYRADQLLADVVRSALRGSQQDVDRVQTAARNFVRAVRERRQDGATLIVESNGRGRIEVSESMPPPTPPRLPQEAAGAAPPGTVSDRLLAIERRVAQIESGFASLAPNAEESGGRVSHLERRIAAFEWRPPAAALGEPPRGMLKGRGTAIEAFAEGLRAELRERIAASLRAAEEVAVRCDKASALAAEAERVLGAPAEGISEGLRNASSQAAAREQALRRVHTEVDLYAGSDLPLAERLVARLVEGPQPTDPAGPLERQAQSLVRAARGQGANELRAWLTRAAALCGWGLIDPAAGEAISPQLHVVVDSGGDRIARVAAPGLRRKDGSVLCRARVEVSAEAHAAETAAVPPDSEEVELLAEEPIGDAAPGAEEAPLRTERFAVLPKGAPDAKRPDPAPPPVPGASASPPGPPAAPPAAEVAPATSAAEGPPELVPGLPFPIPGGEPRDLPPLPGGPAAVLNAAPVDDLALATAVAAAVETETGEDTDWAQLARGPDAFPMDPAPPDLPPDGADEKLAGRRKPPK